MIQKSNGQKQVLIVDDEPALIQMLTMMLETRGYHVKVATSGSEAIENAGASLDLILLDLVLPDSEGFEVCRRLKEERQTSHIPIIILTAKYLNHDKIEGLYLGADDYLTKPFDYEELFARMEAVMRRRSILQTAAASNGDSNLILELRNIIDKQLILPFFQPIYLLDPFQLYGLEVLSRPKTDSLLANPELLFKAAIKFGLYCDLEILSWKKALDALPDELHDKKIFLNCNPYLIEGPKFYKVLSLFKEHNIDVDDVILEITERSAISDYKIFYELLRRFRKDGFRFAVDDVGGGYASLESIVEIRPEVLKIDRHIITDLQKDAYKRSIVKFIVSFCRENKIMSVAEGIETKEDLYAVRDLGVDAAQGYYLYKPTSVLDLARMTQPNVSL
jgi:EAL domain-containing protein (putative c-di-GMP-specific phosphodiesterase class I)/CheY-like chemotaxis protein